MKRIEAYQTSDGVTHTDRTQAIKHADNRYGDYLTLHARSLARLDKYKDILEYLDEQAHGLARLSQLKVDIEIEEGQDDD